MHFSDCPKCRSEDVDLYGAYDGTTAIPYFARCNCCGYRTKNSETAAAALEAWNNDALKLAAPTGTA
jgi:hypothetical protein